MSEYNNFDKPGPDMESKTKRVRDILGDPTIFPIDFRNWLKAFIEGSGLQLPYTAIMGKPARAEVSFTGDMPPGTVFAYAGDFGAATGALVCNGQEVSRETYATLFAVIGTRYGAGDGSTTFLVPDARDRALYGVGSQVPVAATDGQALGNRGPKHHHNATVSGTLTGGTNEVGDHAHSETSSFGHETLSYNAADSAGTDWGGLTGGNTGGGGRHSHSASVSGSLSGATSGGGALDTPGFLGITYVIVTGL